MKRVAIRAGRLIDGTGGAVIEDGILEIAGEKIRSVSRGGRETPCAAEEIDFSEATVIPGLIDCHVHLCMSGTLDRTVRERQLNAGFEEAQETIAMHLNEHLRSGVVAVRDAGDRFGHTLAFKQGRGTEALLPRLQVAGKAWHAPGRYGSLIGRPPEIGEPLARAVLRESRGIDWVKIIHSGVNSLLRYGSQTPPQFTEEALITAAQAAAEKGLPVMVHANGVAPVSTALSAEVRSIEHGFFMGTETLKRMCGRPVWWIPTAAAMKAFTDPKVAQSRARFPDGSGGESHASLQRKSLHVAQQTVFHQLEQIREAKGLGVKIALGTDSGSLGVDHGKSVIREIALLMEAGFSISEALHCASGAGAALLGLEALGTLTPGKDATFLVVPGKPEALPESLFRIRALFIKGKQLPSPTP